MSADPSSPPPPSPQNRPALTPAALLDLMPLCRTLGMVIDSASPTEVAISLDWAPAICTTGGLIHGGALMTLADSAGAVCAYLNLPDGTNGTTTIESKTNFLAGVKAGGVTATSRPLHAGKTTIVIETEIRDRATARLITKTTQTQAVLRPR